ncbi:MAG: hypothetical protein QM751_04135 [Paludibacteraceae bacterium]
MESIQISKGVASVKNGYEAIAGQINVEYKKPKNSDPLSLNAYLNSAGRTEFNATSGLKLKENLFTGIFMHVSDELVKLDINKDGYIDMPMVKQYNFANRWHYENDGYIMQAMIRALSEKRMGGLIDRSYKVGVNTERYEFFLKNGLIFNTYSHEGESEENGFNSSLGLILSGSVHRQDASFGLKNYDGKENNLYANLIYDMSFGKVHKLSVGTSFNADVYDEILSSGLLPASYGRNEYTSGAFAEYSIVYKNITAMSGIRIDHNSLIGNVCISSFSFQVRLKRVCAPASVSRKRI